MFMANLILITKASKASAKNCLLYLQIIQDLTDQRPNLLKSAIFVPSWCNHKLSKSISRILGISLGTFPFTYLGIPISRTKLMISQLLHIPNRVNKAIHSWNHSPVSTVGRVTLLNSTIFAIPNYILFVMHLPNSILDSISKSARSFLCGRTSNNRCFHSVGWTIATRRKLERGGGGSGSVKFEDCQALAHG